MKKVLLLMIIVLLTVVGCGSSNLKNISYDKFKNMIEEKQSFVVYIGQEGCSACEIFNPTFKEVLSEYKLTAYYINLTDLSADEQDELRDVVAYTGTPTVAFITKGIDEGILTHIADGGASKDSIISKFKTFEYIKN